MLPSAFKADSLFGGCTNSKVGNHFFFAVACEPYGQIGIAAELAPQDILGGDRQALCNSADQRLTSGVQL